MFFPRRFGRDRIIVDVSKRFRAGSGVGGELMDRCELDPGVVRDNGFSAVPLMRFEIPNRHALSAVLERVKRRDGDIAEVTKTHRAIARGVMSRWPHQTERMFALRRRSGAFHSGAARCK